MVLPQGPPEVGLGLLLDLHKRLLHLHRAVPIHVVQRVESGISAPGSYGRVTGESITLHDVLLSLHHFIHACKKNPF